MAKVISTNRMLFPATETTAACGALIVAMDDGSSRTTIAPGLDGTMPPGIDPVSATILAAGAPLPAAPENGAEA